VVPLDGPPVLGGNMGKNWNGARINTQLLCLGYQGYMLTSSGSHFVVGIKAEAESI